MAVASYNGNRLVPAPLLSFSPKQNVSADGTVIGVTFDIVVHGVILSHKGSPTSSGTFYTGAATTYPADESPTENQNFEYIIRKQDALRNLFSQEGKSFEFQPLTGAAPLKFNPRNIRIEFAESKWFNRCDYTITCEADVIYGGPLVGTAEYDFPQYISEANETWSIDEDFDTPQGVGLYQNTFRVNHSVSAKGKRFYDETGTLHVAWREARDYVVPRLGFDTGFLLSSGIPESIAHLRPFNHISNESIDELGGVYSITESWILASGSANVAAFDEFEVSKRTSSENGLTSVSINGTVRGLEYEGLSGLGIGALSRYQNASTYFSNISGLIYQRATQYSNINSLNIQPLSTVIGINPLGGTINYSYEYDDRPSHLITGAKMESINISNNFNVDGFATVFVLGKTRGPVLQDLGTKHAKIRNCSIEAVFAPNSGLAGLLDSPLTNGTTSGSIQAILDYVRPNGAFISQQNENWDGKHGRLSYNVEYTWV